MLNKFTKIIFSAQPLQSFFREGGNGGGGMETSVISLMYSLGFSYTALETEEKSGKESCRALL